MQTKTRNARMVPVITMNPTAIKKSAKREKGKLSRYVCVCFSTYSEAMPNLTKVF